MSILDITLAVCPELACWPGDEPFRMRTNAALRHGDSVNLASVSMSLHTGTHADAPYHYRDDGAKIAALPLDVYIGPAYVIDVEGFWNIGIEQIESRCPHGTTRLLMRTNAWTDHTRFPESIPVIDPDVPKYLSGRGVVLLGLDVPSVDRLDSKDLPNHHTLGLAGIHILESLALAGVPPGPYELIAAPLKLLGADGSPVRAALRTLD